jgi:RimJ/RimL family protein N-acetyltransferase
MKESDTDAFLRIFSDPEAMKYFGVIFDRARMEKWVKDNLAHQKEYGFSLMTVVLKENDRIIGDCGLETTEIEGVNTVGIGFDFIRKYWNQGFATEAGKAVLEYGFKTFDFDKISAWIDPQNAASRRVAEKIGMSLEKTVLRGKKEYSIYSIGNPIRK